MFSLSILASSKARLDRLLAAAGRLLAAAGQARGSLVTAQKLASG